MTGDVAKLYSQALFELCLENNSLKEVHDDMAQCAEVFSGNPDFTAFLSSPLITFEEKTDVINKVFGTEGTVRDFICVITHKNRIRYFGDINEAFDMLYDEHFGIREYTVITSVPLKKDAREKLLKKLEEKSGKTIELHEEVDPSIIGGVILKTKDSLLDGSIRGRLETMADNLKVNK